MISKEIINAMPELHGTGLIVLCGFNLVQLLSFRRTRIAYTLETLCSKQLLYFSKYPFPFFSFFQG